ncbi:MAG: hypothetical protein HOB88_01155 [Bacteroidetes bacterium]|nr:hypothetical protein [Bacteroidota bacterium]
MKQYFLLIFLLLPSIFAKPQSIKTNKIDLGCHVTYFFDERGFQFQCVHGKFPFTIFRSISYSKSLKDSSLELQFKFTLYESESRIDEYEQKKILYKSFEEIYSYINLNILKRLYTNSWSKYYILIGLMNRGGAEIYNESFWHWDVGTNDRMSVDFGLTAGFRIESQPLYNFYVYVQPQYNFYLYKQHKAFLRNEIIGNAGIGYTFGKREKSK